MFRRKVKEESTARSRERARWESYLAPSLRAPVLQAKQEKIERKRSPISKAAKLLFNAFLSIGFVVGIVFLLLKFQYPEQENLNFVRYEGATREVDFHGQSEYIEEPDPLFPQISQESAEFDLISAISYTTENGQVLFAKDADKKRSIASITKLMTAIIVLEEYDWESPLTLVEPIDPEEVPITLNLEVGDSMSVQDAYNAMMVGSYNDVAYLVAQNYPGGYRAFIDRMNVIADELLMTDTSFNNPAGLDDANHYSTVNDLRKLTNYALEFEEIKDAALIGAIDVRVQRTTGVPTTKRVYATNFLLSADGRTRGLKTGYTEGAGGCFVGYFEDPKLGQVVTIILGVSEEGNRFDETLKLLGVVNKQYGALPQ